MNIKYNFNVHVEGEPQVITQFELQKFADYIGLSKIANDRFSWLFVLNLYLHEQVNGISPSNIVDEIRKLEENDGVNGGTKPATKFKKEPLKGLWHKHFFSAHFVAQNILNQIAGDKLKDLAKEVFDPLKSSVITEEMVNEFSHRIAHEQLENRYVAGKLTGEWIVFAKYNKKNYYLCISTHTSGDQDIYDQIESVCFPQFPFLSN